MDNPDNSIPYSGLTYLDGLKDALEIVDEVRNEPNTTRSDRYDSYQIVMRLNNLIYRIENPQ